MCNWCSRLRLKQGMGIIPVLNFFNLLYMAHNQGASPHLICNFITIDAKISRFLSTFPREVYGVFSRFDITCDRITVLISICRGKTFKQFSHCFITRESLIVNSQRCDLI